MPVCLQPSLYFVQLWSVHLPYSIGYGQFYSEISLMELLIAILVLLVAPVTAHARIIEIPPEYFYFTHYDLHPAQTDSSPCIGASGKDLCKLNEQGINTMALTVDVRKRYGLKWWDIVQLVGDKWCAGTYRVEDEMGKRFRTGCIKRQGVCIKGDLPWKPWWVCRIKK